MKIRDLGLCGALTAAQFQYLCKHATIHTLQPDTELIGESTETEVFSIIISGVVKLSKLMIDGRQQLVGFQFTPSLIGRPFGGENECSAECATEVELFSFPKSIIDRLITENPMIKHKLLCQALDELDEARVWMLGLGRKSARERIASFLLFIMEHAYPGKEPGSVVFELPMRRSDIADFLGLATETISREMTKLRLHDVIQITNISRITINNRSQLSKLAGL